MKHLFFFNKYFRKYKFRLLLGILFVSVSNYFGVLSPRIIRYSFDLVKENIGFYRLFNGLSIQEEFYSVFGTALMFFGLIVLLLAVLKGLFMFFMRQTIIVMSRFIEYDLKNEIYRHYQFLSTAFYRRNNTGDLMSRISEDVSRVRMYLGPAIMYSINLVVLFVLVISAMIAVNPKLTFYVLTPLPILSISIYYINNLINKRSEAIQQKLSKLTTEAQEVYSGIRVIKSFVQEKQILGFFDKESEEYKEKALKLARVEAFFFPMMLMLIGISTILTIYIGGIQVIQGVITPGNVAEFVIYVNMLTWPVTSIGWVASIIQRAAASQKRINEFLDTPPEISSKNPSAFQLKGAIAFKNVSFTYPDTGIRALRDIEFELKPGEKMAVVGKTGSGKSTVAELLMRMYDATSGEILIDKTPVKDLNLDALRAQIAYVPQDVFLFSDTIENNISFGLETSDIELVKEAAKRASIHDEIMELPRGYNTLVGERGVTLSGGQKQRISLARAFAKNPQLIILDDCLSAVDANTEKVILSTLSDFLKDKTAIIITHRIFSLLDPDKIIVLEDGAVIESGTHKSLISSKGKYYEMYKHQQEEEKIQST
ncbi:MAG: ABC transporter ATP-binding protein [Chitinophagales bacterium]